MSKNQEEKIRKVCIDCMYFCPDDPHVCAITNKPIEGVINEPRECETYVRKESPVSDYMDDFNVFKWKIGKSPFNDYRQQYCNECREANCYKEKIDIFHCIRVRKFFDGEKEVGINAVMDLITKFTTGMVKTKEEEKE